MVTLPKQRVREVRLRCRFCAHYHFNTQNKGIAFVPGKILSEGLLQLRQAAARAVYEEGILEPCHAFKYQSSSSISSVELENR